MFYLNFNKENRNCNFALAILLTAASLVLVEPAIFDLLEIGVDYALDALIEDPQIIFNPPANNNNSIKYNLYNRERGNESCYIEPSADQFDKCSFDPTQETKFLVHGFVAILKPENMFNELKDDLLDYGNYNVVIVDWSLYNNFPFSLAYRNARIIGEKLAEMMEFISSRTAVSPETFHCIGHSLGAHICGLAGRIMGNLGRITGLDPGAVSIFLHLEPNIRLYYTDAIFVDVIHTSDMSIGTGLGYQDPIGHIDVYPDGGAQQRSCQKGNQYKIFNGKVLTEQNVIDNGLCNHFIVIEYFRYSIKENCRFRATRCDTFSSYEQNLCSKDDQPVTEEMGFHSKKIPGLPVKSKFFMKTIEFPPYCDK